MARPRTYYRDERDNGVKGLLVVEEDGDELRVTENRERGWCAPFWMTAQEFRTHTHGDSVLKVGLLDERQFNRVLNQST